jgi:hypothetical protein
LNQRQCAPAIAALMIAGLLFAAPQRAEASGGGSFDDLLAGLVLAMLVILAEPIFPDLHMEFGEGVENTDLTLAWPIPVSFGGLEVADGFVVGLTGFVEPQYRVVDEANRLVFGGRIPMILSDNSNEPEWGLGPGIFVEGGGIVGDDGSGFIAGGGLTVGGLVAALGLNYRFMQVGGDNRHAVTVDLHLALPIFIFWDDF